MCVFVCEREREFTTSRCYCYVRVVQNRSPISNMLLCCAKISISNNGLKEAGGGLKEERKEKRGGV